MSIMESLSVSLLETISRNGQMVVASLDQTAIGDDRAIAMLSIRVGERAVPLFWSVTLTKGNMPVSAYLPLLERLKNVLPEHSEALILGDRFFGTSELIAACHVAWLPLPSAPEGKSDACASGRRIAGG